MSTSNPDTVLSRVHLIETDPAIGSLVDIERTGSLLRLQFGQRLLAQRRRIWRGLALGGILLGIALAPLSIWTLLLSVVGVGLLLFSLQSLPAIPPLELDASLGVLHVYSSDASLSFVLFMDTIYRLRAVCEPHGMEPGVVIYAALQNNSEMPIVVLRGPNRQFAEAICRALGQLMDVPAYCEGVAVDTRQRSDLDWKYVAE